MTSSAPPVRGISYATGQHPPEVVPEVMRTIREDLHCTSVMLMDGDTARQMEAARIALAAGLDVVIRPYLPDRRRNALIAHLAHTADAAENLRKAHPGRVILLVGSEFSLTSPGMLPGPRVFLRVQVLVRWRRFFDRRITRKLNRLLPELVRTARARFEGPITYAAGFWEQVDWSEFDIVGINLYRLGTDHAAYEARVRALARDTAKPVFVTEFGCGAFLDADRRGPGSFLAVNWFTDPPRMRAGHVRDEATQAGYLGELIDLFGDAGVDGCFVFTFSMTEFPHHDDPAHDIDMAGFGVVMASAENPNDWEPKAAFHEVARRYAH